MVAGDHACSSRNDRPEHIHQSVDAQRSGNQYPCDVRVAYRGPAVSIENFLSVLTDSLPEETPASLRLKSGSDRNLIVYMTGHGGNEYFKFREHQELRATEFAAAIHNLHAQKRYRVIQIIIDTCEAATMTSSFKHLPHVYSLSSSVKGESSYSRDYDTQLGLAINDRFTFLLSQHLLTHRGNHAYVSHFFFGNTSSSKYFAKLFPPSLTGSTTKFIDHGLDFVDHSFWPRNLASFYPSVASFASPGWDYYIERLLVINDGYTSSGGSIWVLYFVLWFTVYIYL